MKRILLYSIAILVVVSGLTQLVPINRRNPPVEADLLAPPEVKAVLRRACYDCHSNETIWPWYSRLAPFSWMIVRDVRHGRDELNFSTWDRYTAKQQTKKMKESWEEIAEGEMPPWQYLLAHPEARLSAGDRELFKSWARGIAASGERLGSSSRKRKGRDD